MPLKLFYRPSFERSLKRLDPQQISIVVRIIEALNLYYSQNCDSAISKSIYPGFFYKQLRKPYYEAGIEKTIRVVIRREQSRCIAVIAGDHDQIRRFLHNE